MAEHQYKGKGQRGRVWHVEAGKNLTTSILLQPSFLRSTRIFDLSKAVAVGVAQAIEDLSDLAVHIKWPNDIYVNGKKIAGILIENQWGGSKITESIIGIGINVLQEDFPPEAARATSLKIACPTVNFDLEDVRLCLNGRLEEVYLNLRAGQERIIDRIYHSHLFQKDKIQSFLLPDAEGRFNQPLRALIEGVNTAGELVLKKNGETLCFSVGNIEYVLG